MKTTIPTVNLLLSTYANKDGSRNIQIRVQWNGRCLRSTGYAVLEKDWDQNRQVVRKSDRNSAMINDGLAKSKKEVLDRMVTWNKEGRKYTAKELLEGRIPDTKPSDLKYKTLVDMLAEERGLRYSTKKSFLPTYKRISDFFQTEEWLITDINENNVQGLCRSMKNQNYSDSTINETCKKIGTIWHYAAQKGLVSEDDYPFKNWSFCRVYSEEPPRHRVQSEEDFNMLLWGYINRYTYMSEDGKPWHENIDDLVQHYTGKQFSLAIYLMGFFMNGMALVDILRIKKDQVSEMVSENENTYYVIKGHYRRKTNEPITCVFPKDWRTEFLMDAFMYTADLRNGFLFPGFHDINIDDDKAFETRRKTITGCTNVNLGWWAKELKIKHFTYYYCRHTQAMVKAKEGMPYTVIASLMGRSVEGIGAYIKKITNEEELTNILDKFQDK